MPNEYHCQECGTAIQSNSELCIACFRRSLRPCPKCMYSLRGTWVVRRQVKHLKCAYCNNERWILAR